MNKHLWENQTRKHTHAKWLRIKAGDTFDRWTVLSSSSNAYVMCLCDCGTERSVSKSALTSGQSKSCGCLKVEAVTTHGDSRSENNRPTTEYKTWGSIKSRCHRPEDKSFKHYGARGISMHPAWRESFESFLADVGRRPADKHSLDRINNNGNYEPGNVRWATQEEQNRNKRNVKMFVVNGKETPICALAEQAGLRPQTVTARLRRGWTIEEALSTPARELGSPAELVFIVAPRSGRLTPSVFEASGHSFFKTEAEARSHILSFLPCLASDMDVFRVEAIVTNSVHS